MSTAGGGWTRIVKTNSNNHRWGQEHSHIAHYTSDYSSTGVYNAFRYYKYFRQIMIKKNNYYYSYYYLPYNYYTWSMADYMNYCRTQRPQQRQDGPFRGHRSAGHTSYYSGYRQGGNAFHNYYYYFMCGVNESSDNDIAYISFSDRYGHSNYWGDSWRGCGQRGTLWSYWNNDYHYSGKRHIGNGDYGQCGAGYKSGGSGTYEIFVK